MASTVTLPNTMNSKTFQLEIFPKCFKTKSCDLVLWDMTYCILIEKMFLYRDAMTKIGGCQIKLTGQFQKAAILHNP